MESLHGKTHLPHSLLLKNFLENFEETAILPEQFWAEDGIELPEKKLCIAVLEDAISCYIMKKRDKGVYRRNRYNSLIQEAEEWFQSRDKDVFSFEWICDHLNLNADFLRGGITKLRDKIIAEPDLTLRKKSIPMLWGKKRFPPEKITALVQSFNKIEIWQDFSKTDFRNNELNYWRQLFSYILRFYTTPRLSWVAIGKVLKCNYKTAENLCYNMVYAYHSKNGAFQTIAEKIKIEFKTLSQEAKGED